MRGRAAQDAPLLDVIQGGGAHVHRAKNAAKREVEDQVRAVFFPGQITVLASQKMKQETDAYAQRESQQRQPQGLFLYMKAGFP